MKKIAFCFLIRLSIQNEDIWKLYFKDVDKNKYNIYIHPKNIDKIVPKIEDNSNKIHYETIQIKPKLKHFSDYIIENNIETIYGDISLIHAQNLMLKEALKDDENQHFILLSESCIPLKSFDDVYNGLNEEKSYFNLLKNQAGCFPRCDDVMNYTNRENIQKSSQWCILNRKHTRLMVEGNQEYLIWFKKVYAADEHCYITNIYHHNLQDEIISTPDSSEHATTFTNWGGKGYKYEEGVTTLKMYSEITEEELLYLLDECKCFFGRKFSAKMETYLLNHNYYINKITNNNPKS